jgi:excisionase family DNA binding protein
MFSAQPSPNPQSTTTEDTAEAATFRLVHPPRDDREPKDHALLTRLDALDAGMRWIEETLKCRRVEQEWFSIKEAAVLTGLSAKHLRRAVLGGTLPASNVGTPDRPVYRISREDLKGWMDRRKAGALPPPGRKRAAAPQPPVSRHHARPRCRAV